MTVGKKKWKKSGWGSSNARIARAGRAEHHADAHVHPQPHVANQANVHADPHPHVTNRVWTRRRPIAAPDDVGGQLAAVGVDSVGKRVDKVEVPEAKKKKKAPVRAQRSRKYPNQRV